jgi:hypothetical protein
MGILFWQHLSMEVSGCDFCAFGLYVSFFLCSS